MVSGRSSRDGVDKSLAQERKRGLTIPANICQIPSEVEVAMATMNVSLPDPMKDWVESQTKSGRYSNASDYVRDLIRRDQDRQTAVAELQRLVDEGLESGPPQAFDMETFLTQMREEHAAKDA